MEKELETKAAAQGTAQGQSPFVRMAVAFVEKTKKAFAKNRFAEEREWYESALFYQRRQWLTWNSNTKRWSLVKKDPQKPKPMPVTNHFAKTINSNANQLGAGIPQMTVSPRDDSQDARQQAEYGDRALTQIDIETEFEFQVATLAKHVVLWGIGVTKDFYDGSRSTGITSIPQMSTQQTLAVTCPDCGQNYDVGPVPEGIESDEQLYSQQYPCPQCGSQSTMPFIKSQPVVEEVKRFSRGRLCTEVRPIFEFFFPRNISDPNLAPARIHAYRKPKGEAKRIFGAAIDDCKCETNKEEQSQIYVEALRSLINYNSMQEEESELLEIVEWWGDWDQLPEKLQQAIELECQQNPPETWGAQMDPLECAMQWGVYFITCGGQLLDWGIDPNEGETPITFYLWEKDPANPHPKGLAEDLKPLQKRLNRLDSLIELAFMTNAVGKWLWPKQQSNCAPPSGTPNEVVEWDAVGDGKMKPEFVVTHPMSPQAYQLRAQILQDFKELGYTNAVMEGSLPEGNQNMPFRGLAYLGAKASESLNTARKLWELGHKTRKRKLLKLAAKMWDEPRKVSVAGYNGRRSAMLLSGQQLKPDLVEVDVVPDSSRTRTVDEKIQLFGLAVQFGVVDPTDPSAREYILDIANLEGVNASNHLQYTKAARDLDRLLRGEPPKPNQYMNWAIHLKFFADFMMTEEFEALEPQIAQGIGMYTAMLNAQMSAAMPQPMAAPGGHGGGTPGAASESGKKALTQGGTDPLSGVPGVTNSPASTEQAAAHQAANVGNAMP